MLSEKIMQHCQECAAHCHFSRFITHDNDVNAQRP